MTGEVRITIASEIDATRAVLQVDRFSQDAGFAQTPSRMIATAVSELAQNILRYAGSGEIRVRVVERCGGRGVEIEALDEGPGIADPDRALEDHYSTGGTLGLGLPGVRRLMDEFDLDTRCGRGTRVTARKWL